MPSVHENRTKAMNRAAGAVLVTLLVMLPQLAHAVYASPDEMAEAHRWVAAKFEKAEPPFSFTYGGRPSAELLKTWKLDRKTRKLDQRRTRHTLTYTDSKTGLVIRCVAVEYHDFPTVEWTLYFKNIGPANTLILEDIRALDVKFQRGSDDEFLLHHALGSLAKPSDYKPLETLLKPEVAKRIAPVGGRPSNGQWPYFNLQWGSEGMIAVVGWPGQWAAEFARDGGSGIRIRAGQELTHFKLLAGEEVRSPLIVLQFWKGDYIRSQNIWRRWMMAHSMPKPGGKLPPPQILAFSGRIYKEMIHANEENQIMFINRYLEEGLKLDYWWMDAGWYPCDGSWPKTGTWEVDTKRFPKGLRPISDYAHSKGIKILVWFEPERVAPGTWLHEKHPEWLLGGKLLNLGNPEARDWLTNHVDKLLTEQGIDLYRQDFNMDPLAYWRKNDTPDRQGITEIEYVTGYLAYWDELRRRHPNMLIDSCASGGRRNDLETMRRAVPLWRTDHAYKVIAQQCMTYGISLWLPFYGTGTVACTGAPYYGNGLTPVQPYAFWSNVCPSTCCTFDIRVKEIDYAALRRLLGQWRTISRYYYGDYYPLTPYSQQKNVWIAWQFHKPDLGEGMVQAFRRAESPDGSACYKLHGLDPESRYIVTDLDKTMPLQMSGRELMHNGLPVSIQKKPGAVVLTYKCEK